jgi:hypothetical protein
MAKKKKRIDPIKQREKRAKMAAIVGVLVLALVAAYEIPSVMKATKSSPPPVPTTTTATTGGSLPNVAGGASGSAAATSGQLVDTDLPPASGAGQLVSFSVFATKNPFTPQVSATQAGSSAGTPASPATTTPTTTTTVTTTPAAPGMTVVPQAPAPSAAGSTPAPTATPAQQPTVAISVNGVVAHVASQGTFPLGKPVFRLVSWTRDTAQIAIVGGSYASGEATLTLHLGQALTLENQSDGKRYKLLLVTTPSSG